MTHYITHHCTLNCIHCNTFNNFNFKGSVDWLAERDNYKKWSEKVTTDNIGVLGGEPLLHPNLEQILRDIHDWHRPIEGIYLSTNGTLLDKLVALKDVFIETNTTLSISLHSSRWMRKWLTQFKKHFPKLKLSVCNDDDLDLERYTFTDPSGLKGEIVVWTFFHEATVMEDNGRFTVHDSDMNKAHEVCDSKECHSIYKNKLYKCRIAALIKEFVTQNESNFTLTTKQRQLIDQEYGIALDEMDSNTNEKIKEPLSLCAICPENFDKYANLSTFFDAKIRKQKNNVVPQYGTGHSKPIPIRS